MGAATPLAFRPTLAQRTLAGLLCAGSWIVGARTLALLLENLPRLMSAIRWAEVHGEPVLGKWTVLVASVGACVAGGLILLGALTALLMIEGCHVLADDLGVLVEYTTLPGPVARWIGAGRLGWKDIQRLEKRGALFVLRAKAPEGQRKGAVIRFLMVDELEVLILLILERSPNLQWPKSS